MLKQRIITALILAPSALFAILYLPVFWFEIAISGVVAIGAYEWANMSGICERPKKLIFMAVAFAICIALSLAVDTSLKWYQGQLHGLYRLILGIAVLWWVVSLLMVLAYPKYTSSWRNSRA
ncbi:MAG TPA: phosphatidate cytidylyltransferase, partial [Alteromonas australica]|nr:phosphatidate cytidylyltransferase [Alteromonas australica]